VQVPGALAALARLVVETPAFALSYDRLEDGSAAVRALLRDIGCTWARLWRTFARLTHGGGFSATELTLVSPAISGQVSHAKSGGPLVASQGRNIHAI
jgi:hypothetical protein